MINWIRRRRATRPDAATKRLVVVTYVTAAGVGVCRLRDPRWCYIDGRLAFAGEHQPGVEIAFDFDQVLTLETVPAPVAAPAPILALTLHG
jgi:hypothetical protein